MLEVRRQAVHLLGFNVFGIALIYTPVWISLSIVLFCLFFVILGGVLINSRIEEKILPPKMRILDALYRKTDRKKLPFPFLGSVLGLLGIAASLIILGTRAYIPIMVLAWGDSASTIVGIYFGKHKVWKGRSLEGVLGFFFAATIPLFLLTSISPPKILFLALSGAIVEILSPIDDNLTIPLVLSLLVRTIA